MRYLLLIYTNENAVRTPEQSMQVIEGHRKAMAEATQKGFLRGAEPLSPTSTATTVRRNDGRVAITDGPFAETKEQLAGYYLLDCNNLDEAIEIASTIPTACAGGEGCVEIRPIREMPRTANEVANGVHASS